ncbi:MAG: transposase [Verrucomicrobiaceae bacterium]|nr:transposase [Verrucomicrobiaceae bacterium]
MPHRSAAHPDAGARFGHPVRDGRRGAGAAHGARAGERRLAWYSDGLGGYYCAYGCNWESLPAKSWHFRQKMCRIVQSPIRQAADSCLVCGCLPCVKSAHHRGDFTTACMHLLGAADTAAFVTYLAEVFCPTLSRGDLVVMDHLTVHKSPQVAALVEAVGAEVRFLSAYSPDLNPIEKMWSKIKASLRSTGARTPEELDQAISRAFSKITAKDAAGYFASCDYSII